MPTRPVSARCRCRVKYGRQVRMTRADALRADLRQWDSPQSGATDFVPVKVGLPEARSESALPGTAESSAAPLGGRSPRTSPADGWLRLGGGRSGKATRTGTRRRTPAFGARRGAVGRGD